MSLWDGIEWVDLNDRDQRLEVGVDCFDLKHGLVVYVDATDEGPGAAEGALVSLAPWQARQVALKLLAAALEVESRLPETAGAE